MSNSPLVEYTKLSPHHSGQRTMKIDRITPHCVVGQCTIESLGALFANPTRNGSSNYGIDKNGKIGMFVPENCRSWCSSSNANDQRAVTIECASDIMPPYKMKSKVYDSLLELCIDICKRNGKNTLLWIDNKESALAYTPRENEMLLTVHRWFAAKNCPGDWLYSRLGELAKQATAMLKLSSNTEKYIYRVQVGAFSDMTRAQNYAEKLKQAGFPNAFVVEIKK